MEEREPLTPPLPGSDVPSMAQAHGGRLVAKALARHGTTHLFTLCGGHIQAIYDGCLDEGIRVVDTRHEQTAGHAADGYARVTGSPGVCAVTAGPGRHRRRHRRSRTRSARRHARSSASAAPVRACLNHMGSLQDMNHVELMRPHHQVERRRALHRSAPGVRRLRVPRRAGRRPRAGVPRGCRSNLLMNWADDAPPATSPLAPPPSGRRSALDRRGGQAARPERAADVHRGQSAPVVPPCRTRSVALQTRWKLRSTSTAWPVAPCRLRTRA
jgi:acetolactate synthase-1/2/3 large subunit